MKKRILLSLAGQLATVSLAAAQPLPKNASSQIGHVPDRFTEEVPWGSATEIFDMLSARVQRGGVTMSWRDDAKYRIEVDRPATLREARFLSQDVNGSERIRMRFEVTQHKKGEVGHGVTATVFLVQNPGATDEKAVGLDDQLPYRDEMGACLRGVEPDRLR
jgi:hypothetical protein